MSFSHRPKRRLLDLVTDVAAVALAPVLLIAGDSLLKWARDPRAVRPAPAVDKEGRYAPAGTGRTTGGTLPLPRALIATSAVVIALGSPQRWIRDRLGRRPRSPRRRWFPPNGGGLAGVREPRRPLPTPPSARLARRLPGPPDDD